MVPSLPNAVILEMATRTHRHQHFLWHLSRNVWERLTPPAREQFLAAFPGWEPPRPALDATGGPRRDNDSGEDFLYMHREMIARVNRLLAEIGDPNYPRVEAWPRIPPPGDPDYPVPPPGPGEPGFTKSDFYYLNFLEPWERRYTSQEYLTTVTLGQLGADLEFAIHNSLHTRWAALPAGGARPTDRPFDPIDPRWDDPAYDYLGDTYSSHVNPIFWKLHGWIDGRIEDWRRANGVTGPIAWKGTWLGPMEHGPHEDEHRGLFAPVTAEVGRAEMAQLERAVSLLSQVPGASGFIVPVPDPTGAPTG